jgi:hypothetical protein
MAPEQLEGEEADTRTDIFAFGALLYEIVTGRNAFEGKSQASLIGSILKDTPRSISELQPVAPAALDRIVKVCLAKDRGERWQTAHSTTLKQIGRRPSSRSTHLNTSVNARLPMGIFLTGTMSKGSRRSYSIMTGKDDNQDTTVNDRPLVWLGTPVYIPGRLLSISMFQKRSSWEPQTRTAQPAATSMSLRI